MLTPEHRRKFKPPLTKKGKPCDAASSSVSAAPGTLLKGDKCNTRGRARASRHQSP